MKPIVATVPGSAGSRRRTRMIQRLPSAGPLATMMFLYILIIVGRLADAVPFLSKIPLAKIVVVLAVLVCLQSRQALAATPVWSLPLARRIIIFMAVTTVSIFFSVLRSATFGVIIGTVLSVCVGLVLMIKGAQNWKSVRLLLFAYVWSAIVLGYAAARTSFAGRAGEISSLDPNDFAFVLDGLLPIIVTFAVISSAPKRMGYAAASVWVIVTILLTQSRGGLLGLLAEIPLILVLLPSRKRGAVTLRPSPGAITARILVVLVGGLLVWQVVPATARSRLATVLTVSSDQSMQQASDGRFTIWEDTLPLAFRRPWGWGAGAFTTVDGKYAGGKYKAPHNMFLEAVIEVGIPGFILLIAAIFRSLRELARESRAEPKPMDQDALERRAFARGLIASIVGLCASGFFLSQLYSTAFWVTIALTCLVCRPVAVPDQVPHVARERSRRRSSTALLSHWSRR